MIRIASCASNREKRAKFDLIPTELWTIQKGGAANVVLYRACLGSFPINTHLVT
jgi:hypothetical protein